MQSPRENLLPQLGFNPPTHTKSSKPLKVKRGDSLRSRLKDTSVLRQNPVESCFLAVALDGESSPPARNIATT